MGCIEIDGSGFDLSICLLQRQEYNLSMVQTGVFADDRCRTLYWSLCGLYNGRTGVCLSAATSLFSMPKRMADVFVCVFVLAGDEVIGQRDRSLLYTRSIAWHGFRLVLCAQIETLVKHRPCVKLVTGTPHIW